LPSFREIYISRKPPLNIMVTCATALLACVESGIYDVIASRRGVMRYLSMTTELIANKSITAVSFGDQQAAGETLSTCLPNPPWLRPALMQCW
jgi:hypothetical protein